MFTQPDAVTDTQHKYDKIPLNLINKICDIVQRETTSLTHDMDYGVSVSQIDNTRRPRLMDL